MIRETLIAGLQLIHTHGLGHKTFEKIIRQTISENRSLISFVASSASEKVTSYGLKHDVAEAIQHTYEQSSKIADELMEKNILFVMKGMPEYPQKLIQVLGETAPAYLFIKGNRQILEQQGVGFCGSRQASEKGLKVASDCAEILAEEKINVISGYAHGVDLATHRGSMRAGGITTMVLAEGILNFRPKREVMDCFKDDNHVVISEYPPRLTWVSHNAMQRNRTICGMSNAIVVIESGLKGGTFNAGNEAIKLKLPLFVAEYAVPAESAKGNEYFIRKGAIAIRGNREGKPNLGRVFYALHIVPKNPEELISTELGFDKLSVSPKSTSAGSDMNKVAESSQLPMFTFPTPAENLTVHNNAPKMSDAMTLYSHNQANATFKLDGKISPENWMTFYKYIISKLVNSNGFKLTITIEATMMENTPKESLEDISRMLRELNLADQIEIK